MATTTRRSCTTAALGSSTYTDLITMETRPAALMSAAGSLFRQRTLMRSRDYTPRRRWPRPWSLIAGLDVVIDGVRVTTPVFQWPIGSVHRLWAPDGLQTQNDFSFRLRALGQDASAAPSRLLTWQVIAGDGTLGAPVKCSLTTVLTANFARLTR